MRTSKKGFICFVAVCLIVGGLASSASAELLGLWRFNEGNGLTTADASGHGRTGDITARIWTDAEGWITSTDPAYIPTWVDGPADHGKALQFHPSYDESGWPGPVGTPYSVPFVFVYADSRKTIYDNPYDLRGSFTVAAWVSLEDDGSGGVRGPQHGSLFGLANAYQFETPSNTEASFRAWDNSWLWGMEEAMTPAPAVPTNTWTHVAFAYDFPTRNLKLYINGVESASVTAPTADAASTYPGSPWDLRIGAHANEDGGDYLSALSGKLDDVAVFNEALTADQVADVMAGDFSAWPYVPPPPESRRIKATSLDCGSSTKAAGWWPRMLPHIITMATLALQPMRAHGLNGLPLFMARMPPRNGLTARRVMATRCTSLKALRGTLRDRTSMFPLPRRLISAVSLQLPHG